MNYKEHYDRLMTRAKTRILEGYVEKHHIVPKCLGGTDDFTNIAVLTPEEHYIAHLLLVKIYPNDYKLVYSATMMACSNQHQKRNNKIYGWLKLKDSLAKKSRPPKKYKKETKPRKERKKETKPRKKRIITDEHRKNISLAIKGRKHSTETKEKIRKANVETKSKLDNSAAARKGWLKRKISHSISM